MIKVNVRPRFFSLREAALLLSNSQTFLTVCIGLGTDIKLAHMITEVHAHAKVGSLSLSHGSDGECDHMFCVQGQALLPSPSDALLLQAAACSVELSP